MNIPNQWIGWLQKRIDELEKEIPEATQKNWKARIAFMSLKWYLESFNYFKYWN